MNPKLSFFKFSLYFFLIASSFIFGAITVYKRLPPYVFASVYIKPYLTMYEADSYFNNIFVDPIIKKEDLLYSPIKNKKKLDEKINVFKGFSTTENLYQDISIIKGSMKSNYVEVIYSYKNKKDTLYAYLKKSLLKNSKKAMHIIPGSGLNQSSEILYKNSILDNYQSTIDDLVYEYGDCYIFIKPNEDILALHNGSKKISEIQFVNYLLNNSSSYSGYYITQTVALSKYLKEKYEELNLFGLSQGGQAALINAIESKPEKAIISSGYSVLMDSSYPSNLRQIIIPGFHIKYSSDSIYNFIKKSRTSFLFTYGKKEVDIYRREAHLDITKKKFKNLDNVQVVKHPEGHVYPLKEIKSFIEN